MNKKINKKIKKKIKIIKKIFFYLIANIFSVFFLKKTKMQKKYEPSQKGSLNEDMQSFTCMSLSDDSQQLKSRHKEYLSWVAYKVDQLDNPTENERNMIMATTEYTKILYDEAIRCIEQTMIFCNVKQAVLNHHNLQKNLHGIPWNILLFGGLLDRITKINKWSKFRELNLERPFTMVRNILYAYGYVLLNKTNDNLYPIILVMI